MGAVDKTNYDVYYEGLVSASLDSAHGLNQLADNNNFDVFSRVFFDLSDGNSIYSGNTVTPLSQACFMLIRY